MLGAVDRAADGGDIAEDACRGFVVDQGDGFDRGVGLEFGGNLIRIDRQSPIAD